MIKAVGNPVDVYQKMDQQFEDYATPWELDWSNLCFMARNENPQQHLYEGFCPIVDRTWTVIGHIGTVYGGRQNMMNDEGQAILIIPGEFRGMDLWTAINKGVPVFVHGRLPVFPPAG